MVMGRARDEFIARPYRKPMVVAGFEPLDVLQSIWMVLKQIREGRAEIENQYGRVAPEAGNRAALSGPASTPNGGFPCATPASPIPNPASAGKTTMLERTIRDLGAEPPLYVLEGDQATANDAEWIRAAR